MSDKTLYTIIVHSENIAGLLNQVTAVFTRRQINIESLNVSASSIKGVHKYTITAWTDRDTIEKVVKQIEKKIDVIQAHYFTEDEIYFHEIALYKVSTPAFQETPEASKVIRRYNARIVEVNPVFSIVEKNGMSEEDHFTLRRTSGFEMCSAICSFGACSHYYQLFRAGK